MVFAALVVLAVRIGSTPAAEFDSYTLSLSWSPQHCTVHPGDRPQCGRAARHGFVVHGLWPDRAGGPGPVSCGAGERIPDDVRTRMRDIMPSDRLITHEWEKHGTCSGLEARAYFAQVRAAYDAVTIPTTFVRPRTARVVRVHDVRREFLRTNTGMPAGAVRVVCDGRFLEEVHVCLDKRLRPTTCPGRGRDRCGVERVTVPPVH